MFYTLIVLLLQTDSATAHEVAMAQLSKDEGLSVLTSTVTDGMGG